MHMIGHQTPGQHLHVCSLAALLDQFHVPGIVPGVEECLLPPIATLGDVVGNSGNDMASDSGHRQTVAQTFDQIKNKKRLSGHKKNKWGHIQFAALARQAIDRAKGKLCMSPFMFVE